jgi:hypothetical protein
MLLWHMAYYDIAGSFYTTDAMLAEKIKIIIFIGTTFDPSYIAPVNITFIKGFNHSLKFTSSASELSKTLINTFNWLTLLQYKLDKFLF